MKVLSAACLLLWVSAAAIAEPRFSVETVMNEQRSDIQIEDQRSAISIKGGRPGLLKPMTYLADDDFEPNKKVLFERAIATAFANAPQKVIFKRFDVLDVYPQRMGAIKPVQLSDASREAAAIMGEQEVDGDFILCLIDADIDGRTVATGKIVKYKGSATAFKVYKDPPVKAAVEQAVADGLKAWVERAKAP